MKLVGQRSSHPHPHLPTEILVYF